MARSLPSPPLTSLSLPQLQTLANDLDPITDLSPRAWFNKAVEQRDRAILAERGHKKEEMFLAYTRAAHSYMNCKMHPEINEERKRDPSWYARTKDFKETYEAYLQKAKGLKEEFKARDSMGNGGSSAGSSDRGLSAPSIARQDSGGRPDSKPMGSIADRMAALSGRGLDVGSGGRRASKDLHETRATGGAGAFGPTRSLASQHKDEKDRDVEHTPRSRSGSTSNQHPSASPAGPRRPSIPAKPQLPTPPSAASQPPPPAVKPSALGGHSIQPQASTQALQPQLTPEERMAKLRLQDTGASSRSRSSTGARPLPFTAEEGGEVAGSASGVTPVHSGQDVSSSRGPLPRPPGASHSNSSQNAPQTSLPSPTGQSPTRDHLGDFEKNFPSMADFARQFEEEERTFERPPNGDYPFVHEDGTSVKEDRAPPHHTGGSAKSGVDHERLPDVPSFPDLPSVPSSRPGLPPPPSKSDLSSLKPNGNDETAPGPSLPSPGLEIKRPASTPNVEALPGDRDLLSSSPDPIKGDPTPPLPPQSLRTGKMPPTIRPKPAALHHDTAPPAPNGSVSFPHPQPTPGPSSSASASRPPAGPPPGSAAEKPQFPFANSVEPEVLRGYILNPAVKMLLIDVRTEEEFQKGYVGMEYEPRGAKVSKVWIDPTVLLRDNMNSQKLEDAMSLLSDAQRKAFETRHKMDLVVAYDSHSMGWPRKSPTPSPLNRLWDIVYEHEFNKKLERNPVLLTGGYDAWMKFIDYRREQGMKAYYEAQRRQMKGHGAPLTPRETNPQPTIPAPSPKDLAKRANRDQPVYQASRYATNISDSLGHPAQPQSMSGSRNHYSSHNLASPRMPHGSSPPRSVHRTSGSISNFDQHTPIASPPPISRHPGPGSRRRSDYLEHNDQTYAGYPSPGARQTSIDYPQTHSLGAMPAVPAATQSHVSERYDARPSVIRSGSIRGLDLVANQGDEVRYWNDVVLGLTGLKNLGNTCYMNSTIQCLSATYPFSAFFLDGSFKRSINVYNPLGTKGNLANAFSELLKALWKEDYSFLSAVTFRKNIIRFAPQFSGTDQHDSQEFLSFVLDGLHEDLNRVQVKPPAVEMTPEREAELETLPPAVASEKEWQIYKRRDDSFIVDLFQGQYRNRLECLTCHKTSTTYDAFMYMSLPVKESKKGFVVQELIDDFIEPEILDGDDKWFCPRCKVARRASKTLTIARLPPILLIQLKRFSTTDGRFWNKSETPVVFPLNALDLTRYVPARQPQGHEDLDDPRTQVGPFKYDLYGLSNHMGGLSNGHYTAYVKSSKGWMYAEDSRITKATEREVVNPKAYLLFYKRIRV